MTTTCVWSSWCLLLMSHTHLQWHNLL
jgi:hypothetical protein